MQRPLAAGDLLLVTEFGALGDVEKDERMRLRSRDNNNNTPVNTETVTHLYLYE
jgi:hypothetical protein